MVILNRESHGNTGLSVVYGTETHRREFGHTNPVSAIRHEIVGKNVNHALRWIERIEFAAPYDAHARQMTRSNHAPTPVQHGTMMGITEHRASQGSGRDFGARALGQWLSSWILFGMYSTLVGDHGTRQHHRKVGPIGAIEKFTVAIAMIHQLDWHFDFTVYTLHAKR